MLPLQPEIAENSRSLENSPNPNLSIKGTLKLFYYFYIASVYGKLTGLLAHLYIPVFLRPIIIRWYAWRTSSRLYESVKQINEFNTIHEFFTREIKPRPIDAIKDLVAPADCIITSAGRVEDKGYKIEQIKGITYPLEDILGLHPEEIEELKMDKSKTLYYVSIQLPVHECHRFRSPVSWAVKRRTHIPGTMYRLNEAAMFKKQGVMYNERVVLEGEWKHGKFFYVALGAEKVGSVVLKFDDQLKTNVIGERFRERAKGESFKEVDYNNLKTHARVLPYEGEGVFLEKGEEFGFFEGGSAFALVFEHEDNNFHFTVTPPQFILYGNPLCE